MTRSPIVSGILAAVPVLLLAWPLAQVTGIAPPEAKISSGEVVLGDAVDTDIEVFGAGDYESIVLRQGATSVTITPDESEAEWPMAVEWNGEMGTSKIVVEVTWPEGSGEQAVRLEISPEALATEDVTIWGEGRAVQELSLDWKKP